MIIDNIENLIEKLKTRKAKNIIYLVIICFTVVIFGLRFYTVFKENNRTVFNILRDNIKNGTPIQVLEMHEIDGVLYEPLNIKNNRAHVSWTRVNMFRPGQKIGDCKIISVSKNIDLYSGMHIIKTLNCKDGLQYAEYVKRGFYVPGYAVHGNSVYVVNNGIANLRNITIDTRDFQNVLVKTGLDQGDIVILSNVQDKEKIRIVK